MVTKTILAKVKFAVGATANQVSKRKDGTTIVRKSYFYRNGMSAAKFAGVVEAALITAGVNAVVSEYGDKYVPFKGGSTVAGGSHFWVSLNERA